MIDPRLIINFLNRKDVQISIEEYLLLWVVRQYGLETTANKKELLDNALKYYTTNTSFLVSKQQNDKVGYDWNALIENLVNKNFLIDFRQEGDKKVDLLKLRVTEKFSELIWYSNKEENWERFQNEIFSKCGDGIQLQNKKIGYFFVNQSDPIINTPEKLKDYFWINVCKEGNLHEIEKFFYYLEVYLQYNELNMKISNFLINYHEGTLKKEIENLMNSGKKSSYFKSL